MSEVNESGAQVDAKAETSASMSESRRSDEDVIEFDDQVLGPQVVTSSETGRLARDDTNLRRRKPPFQQGIEVPEYEPGNQTLNPPPKSPEGGEVEGDSLGVEEISEGEQKDLGLYETTETEATDSYDSEETNEDETEVDETSDDSGGEGSESLTWAQFLYKGARLALPYFYMIFISLALAYFLYLIDSQQKEIHGLQSRIQSIEQACSRKRAETARSIQFGQ